jgi:hypothetical protein
MSTGSSTATRVEYVKMPEVFYDEIRMVGFERSEISALIATVRASTRRVRCS